MRLRLVTAAFAAAVLALPASALAVGDLHAHRHHHDLDARKGLVLPTAAQKDAAAAMGATVRWNRFGTPRSLVKHGDYLATGLSGTPAEAARAWVDANKGLFRLSSTSGLELLNDVRLKGTDTHVVTFRQRFGDLAAAQDGLLTVAVSNGRIVYASSSVAGDAAAPEPATLSPAEAWVRAANSVDEKVSLVDITATRLGKDGWSIFTVSGFAQEQRSRLVAMPIPGAGARAAFETVVMHVQGADVSAYTIFVDARSGDVLFRRNQVEYAAAPQTEPIAGSYDGVAMTCGPRHEIAITEPNTTIDVVATADVPANDIYIDILDPSGKVVAHADTGTSPEAAHTVANTTGTYAAVVCPYRGSLQVAPYSYTGTVTTSPSATTVVNSPPKWKVFEQNPPLDGADTDRRIIACWTKTWDGAPVPGCDDEFKNLASRAPWDYDMRTNTSSRTTKGNNAISGEAWLSPFTPAEQYRPVSPTREYVFPWTDQWRNSKCSPTVFTSAERNDIDAATVNLFFSHNRMHDWSYHLGFTEETYNLQDVNFGNTSSGPYPVGREGDPEIGNAQAGALDGGAPSYLGRDNANQITLNDGIAPITNMYLWQSIAGAFYAPCVDGDYDMAVIGHEYTHAISNRMIGGPDANISRPQGRAMGESWSDLVAVEYLNEHSYVPRDGENPFAVGAYATGNKETGIRNYAMNKSPLNYSDVGYDFVCNATLVGPPVQDPCADLTQVHADGEIWSATNYDIRQALVEKYNGQYPASDAALQRRCADGALPADQCPGNRRWIQIVFDAFLLMQADVTMVDARDAYLAADVARFGGANQAELWRVFAKRGLGEGAVDITNRGTDADPDHTDADPIPSFESPLHEEATVTFAPVAPDQGNDPVQAEIFVGDYEARVTPVADTLATTERGATAKFVPGTYTFIARANSFGHKRFELTLAAGETRTVTIPMPSNWASKHRGATAVGESGTHLNTTLLIDDTEETNWAATGRTPSVAGTAVIVDLAGEFPKPVHTVQVSAFLRPRDTSAKQEDQAGQNRFTALRAFDIYTCTASPSAPCTQASHFTKLYSSPDDAFPAGTPRPLAPNLILRTFDVPNTTATHVRLEVRTNQCTGQTAYHGDQDNDPLNNTDCISGSANDNAVRAAELQVFGTGGGPGGGSSTAIGSGGSTGGTPSTVVSTAGPESGSSAPASEPTQPSAAQGSGGSSGERLTPPPSGAADPPAAQVQPTPTSGVAGAQRTLRFQNVGGWGAIAGKKKGTRAWFWFRGATGKSQRVRFDDKKAGLVFRSQRISAVKVDLRRSTVTITGVGRNLRAGEKARLQRFVLTVTDRGAKGDVVRMRVAKSYARSGKVLTGGLKIRTKLV